MSHLGLGSKKWNKEKNEGINARLVVSDKKREGSFRIKLFVARVLSSGSLSKPQTTVIQDTLKMGQKYSTVPRARERVSERASERVSGPLLTSRFQDILDHCAFAYNFLLSLC